MTIVGIIPPGAVGRQHDMIYSHRRDSVRERVVHNIAYPCSLRNIATVIVEFPDTSRAVESLAVDIKSPADCSAEIFIDDNQMQF